MKLKEYINSLLKLAKETPEALEMEVITSSDDEGNSYNKIHYSPTLGKFEDKEFIDHKQTTVLNAVCIN